MTRRTFLLSTPALAAACARDRRPRLNVFNWSNYVAPGTIPGFEREFGVRVRYAVYESNEEMLAKLLAGNSGWDVVFPTNSMIRPMLENGLLAELNHAGLPNLRHLDSEFRAPGWDPNLTWCVPYMWGATGILYNRSLAPPPRGWADLWNAGLRGRITMLDDQAEVLGACLKKLGWSLNATDPSQIEQAKREALTLKPLLRAYLNAEVRDQVVAGDVLAAQLWATTALQAMAASPSLDFVYPDEGFPLYADNAVILRESQRGELAHAFLNYLLRPEVAAEVVRATHTATANASARALLPDPVRSHPVLFPPPDVLSRGEWFQSMPVAAQRLRDRVWTEIKAA